MARYRGYDKQHIIESLQNAENFLRSLSIGPATNDMLDEWLKEEPYKEISAAQIDKDLVEAMQTSDAGTVFLRSHEIFRAHALTDTAGKGRNVYEDLMCWGAFAGMVTHELRPSDTEEYNHLIEFYGDYIQANIDPDAALSTQALDASKFLQKIEKDYGAKTVGQAMEVLKDGFVKQEFRDHQVKEAYAAISGLEANFKDELKAKSPFQAYGIAVDYDGKDFQEIQRRANEFLPKLYEVLEKYHEMDEVDLGHVMLGFVTKDQDKNGVLFFATERTAQAVMRALPDQQLVDYNGDPVRFAPPRPKISRLNRPKTP